MVDDRGRPTTGLEMERAGQIWLGRVQKREANDNTLQRFDRQIGGVECLNADRWRAQDSRVVTELWY